MAQPGAPVQGGVQLRTSRRTAVGPYLQLSLVDVGGKDVDAGAHGWLNVGARGTFDPAIAR